MKKINTVAVSNLFNKISNIATGSAVTITGASVMANNYAKENHISRKQKKELKKATKTAAAASAVLFTVGGATKVVAGVTAPVKTNVADATIGYKEMVKLMANALREEDEAKNAAEVAEAEAAVEAKIELNEEPKEEANKEETNKEGAEQNAQ